MSVQPKTRLTVDEFLAWAEDRPGRHELVDGEIHSMSPQRAGHMRAKYRIQSSLERAIAESGLDCEMLPDGMTVRVDAHTAYEPDALVQCGDRIADDAIVAGAPVIVVEVLSPGTKQVDTGKKLEGYFRVPSVVHYLIVDPTRPIVIHHKRGSGDVVETRIFSSGTLTLAPPGLTLSVSDFFGAPLS